ncbi:MAG: ABC transporter substrate-binding protein [Angustibacter sp.]
MTHHRSARAALLAAVVGLTALTASACGDASSAEPAQAAGPKVSVDRALHDRLPDAVKSSGVLRVGTDASYAPMSFFAPDGRTIVGIEPDLAQQIGLVLGVRLEFQNVDFTELLPRVADGSLDVAISAMTDTPERERRVDFVNYFNAGTSIVVQRGNPNGVTDLKDLCGKVVAVEDGTTQVDLVKRSQANCAGVPIRVKTFATNSDALVQLRTGRAAAVLNDYPPASYLTSDVRTKAHYQLASTAQYEPGLYGIAVAKRQQGLRDALRGALETLLETGAYNQVMDHWNVASGEVREVAVNAGR